MPILRLQYLGLIQDSWSYKKRWTRCDWSPCPWRKNGSRVAIKAVSEVVIYYKFWIKTECWERKTEENIYPIDIQIYVQSGIQKWWPVYSLESHNHTNYSSSSNNRKETISTELGIANYINAIRFYYSSSRWRMKIVNSHLAEQKLELSWEQSFGEEVCNLVLGWNMHCFKTACLNLLSHKLTVDPNMFCPLMEHEIGCNMKCCFIITE